MIDFTVAYDKLASMESADEIADFLRHQGVQGIPADDKQCPLAVWIQDITGLSAIVYPILIETNKGITYSTGAIADFVYNFDDGKYPDLVQISEGI